MTHSSRHVHLHRSALLDRINAVMPLRLVALIAPAGFGKTTLVEDWILDAGLTPSVGWLSLNEGHSDPVRFWTAMVSVVEQLGSSIEDRVLAELRSDPAPTEEIAAAIVAKLAALDRQQLIVLDDLHRISDRPLLAAIYRFVEALSSTTMLVVTSRTSPGWPLARMRARGEALLLTERDLVFTRDETAAVLGEVLDDPAAIAVVHERTEGWPVVVRLAAEGIGQSADPHAVINELSATSGRVAGYFVEEILDRLRPELRRFLLDMAVVDKFSVSLAIAMTGPSAAAHVDDFLSLRLLVEPDEHAALYGPHPLIRDLLLDELTASDPDRVRLLHRKAGAWYEARGQTPDAVEHLISGEALDDVVRLLGEAIEPRIVAGQVATVLRWLELLPVEELERRPMAARQLARALTEAARFDEASGWLDLAGRSATTSLQQADITESWMHLEYRRGAMSSVQQHVDALAALADATDDADDLAVIRAHQIHGVGILASCYDAMGQDDKRRETDVEFHANRTAASPLVAYAHESRTARFEAEDGELKRAQQRARWVLRTAARRGHTHLQSNAYSHLALARIAWCRGLLADAETSLLDAARLERGNSIYLSTVRRHCAAEVNASFGRHDRSDEILHSMIEGSGPTTVSADLRSWTAAWAMAICAAHGRFYEARQWLDLVERLGTVEQLSPPLWSQALILNQQYDHLVETFGGRGQYLPPQPLPRLRCALALETALQALGSEAEAEDVGRELILLARRLEIVQPLIDQPAVVHRYRHGGADPRLRPFAGYLSDRATSGLESPTPGPDDGLIEALTARELDVVQLLPTRLTNSEIADELNIALNTIKSHLRSIYRKLEVSSRDDAIERLRRLDLL